MTPVPGNALLWIYIVIPLLGALLLLDKLVFGQVLLFALPDAPEELLFYAVLFNLPHVIASFISFADAEYLKFYGKKLWIGLPLLWSASAALIYFSPIVALVLYIVFTMYHFRMQQAGVALFFIGKPPTFYMPWIWVSVATGSILYGSIRYGSDIAPYLSLSTLVSGAAALLIIFSILTFILLFSIPKRGRAYFSATAFSIVATFLFIVAGYPIFAIIAGRIIHDATAMIIYAVQAHNRSRVSNGNILYRLLRYQVPILFSFPLFAISIAYAFREYAGAGAMLFMLLGVTHYYLEGFIWRKNTIHRQHLPIST